VNAIVTGAIAAGLIYPGLRFFNWAVVHAIWTVPAGAGSALCRAAKGEGAGEGKAADALNVSVSDGEGEGDGVGDGNGSQLRAEASTSEVLPPSGESSMALLPPNPPFDPDGVNGGGGGGTSLPALGKKGPPSAELQAKIAAIRKYVSLLTPCGCLPVRSLFY
jgi:hypothetical protein